MTKASYFPPYIDKDRIFVAPLSAELETLEGLQPQSSACCMLCCWNGSPEGQGDAIYCRGLEEAGVKIDIKEYPEAIHGFTY
ncbi:hypothetical protein K469DRAFT_760323 [Zopfia rhizophila CBS 207.26]|uniref:Alpha/beta hydrolase fold-3 domain-containing protein n=1 Tax=Zopfia rhizophila CBS 207.26 TaxID=1314779 RepID=A0A6A6DEK8_9PEZI|nr:hypothetical protein K469DRAFT_760323 [Zopfia rhizophila CBS 207.26]